MAQNKSIFRLYENDVDAKSHSTDTEEAVDIT